MVTKSTILATGTGTAVFILMGGFGAGLLFGVTAGLTTAAITKVAAARVFHEGEAKAPEGVRERPLMEEVKKSLLKMP